MPLPGYLSLNYVTDLRVDSKLGAGGGGTIYLGELLNATVRQQFGISSQVVIKHAIEHEDLTPAERQLSFEQEVIVMSTLSFHKNVVTLLGFCLDPHVLVLPYFPAGDLANLIADPTLSISFIHAYELAHDMASALQAAHSLGIVHRDVKTANFLIEAAQRPGGGDPLYIARLTDFGVCRIKESGPRLAGQKFLNLFGLSVRYAAPEVFSRLQLSTTMEIAFDDETKTDVYAYAICLWEVLSRQVPWGTRTREEITQAVTRGQRPPMPATTGDALQAALLKLVVSCWDQTPRSRPTFSDVCRILDGMTSLPSASNGRAPVPPGRPANPSTLRRTAPAAPPPRPSTNTTTVPIAPISSSASNNGMSRTAPHVPPKPAAQAPRPPTLAPKPPAPAPKPPVLPPKAAPTAAEPPGRVHVAVYAYTATKEDEMDMAEGDQLMELEVSDDGWVKVVPLSDMNATPKWAPGNYLQLSG